MTDAIQLLKDAYELTQKLEANGYRLIRCGTELILQDHNGVDVGVNEMVERNYDALLVIVRIDECFADVSVIVDDWREHVLND